MTMTKDISNQLKGQPIFAYLEMPIRLLYKLIFLSMGSLFFLWNSIRLFTKSQTLKKVHLAHFQINSHFQLSQMMPALQTYSSPKSSNYKQNWKPFQKRLPLKMFTVNKLLNFLLTKEQLNVHAQKPNLRPCFGRGTVRAARKETTNQFQQISENCQIASKLKLSIPMSQGACSLLNLNSKCFPLILTIRMVHKFIVFRLQAQNLEILGSNKGLIEKLSNEQFDSEEAKYAVAKLKEQISGFKVESDSSSPLHQEAKTDEEVVVQVLRPQIQIDTFYDVIINCESVLKLTAGSGWEIKINTDIYDQKKQQNTVVVSFYGLYNKGKTFLASKLSNKGLPRGYSISTVGLSALYPADLIKENSIVFLDTAGTETPICYQKEDEMISKHIKEIINENSLQDMKSYEKKQFYELIIIFFERRRIYELKLKDRLLTEHLLQRFILSQSNVVMIVVDQLTKEEQRLIQKIKNIFGHNEIIIIHNFSKLVSKEDVECYIKKDILESFEVQEQYRIFDEANLKGAYYVENRFDITGQKLPDITHVVMAFHQSEAGNIYNLFCYHYLRTRILAITQAKQFDIISQLITMLKTAIPEIVDVGGDQMNQIEVYQQNNFITANLNTTNLKSISFDLLGDLKVFKGGLDPKFSMVIMNKEKLILQVELCGPFQASEHDAKQFPKRIISFQDTEYTLFEWHGFRKDHNDKSQYIMLRGVKSDLKPSNERSQTLHNNRQKGEFRMIIPMNPAICVLRDGKPKCELKSGIIQLIYELQSNIEEIDLF